MAKDKAQPAGKSPAQEFRELVVCLGVAVMLALLIKFVLIENFVIPSGSMEPTLNGRPDGGDRVLCTKFNYRWRSPQRWEIFVFLYPFEQARARAPQLSHEAYQNQNFIKRCVGLPGETIALQAGDVFTSKRGAPYVRQVKSDAIQRRIWIPVYAESFADLRTEELAHFWRQGGQGEATVADGSLRLTGSERVTLAYRPRCRDIWHPENLVELEFVPDRYVLRQPVTFRCPDCGASYRKTVQTQNIEARCPKCHRLLLENSAVTYGRRSDLVLPSSGFKISAFTQGEEDKLRQEPYHATPDLRWTAKVQPVQSQARLTLELNDEAWLVQASLGGGNPGRFELAVNGRPQPQASGAADFAPGRWHEVEFYRLDGRVRLFLDGQPLVADFALPIPEGNDPTLVETPRRTGAGLFVSGGTVLVDELSLDRDIYYFPPDDASPGGGSGQFLRRRERFQVPDDGYLALGDNSPSSNDSRYWGAVPAANLRGPAIFTWWPPHRARWLAQWPDEAEK